VVDQLGQRSYNVLGDSMRRCSVVFASVVVDSFEIVVRATVHC
jgi:hypothetical protein